MDDQQIIERDHGRIRREVLLRRVLDGLQQTVRLRGMTPDTPIHEVRVEFTDASAAFIAPLIEAVDILEAIIFASDGCAGHRQCVYSMEPWQRARALVEGKWQSDCNPTRKRWPLSGTDDAQKGPR